LHSKLICLCLLPCVTAAQPPLPATAKKPVTDTYHGVTVTDDYRWLEDFNVPAVKQWAAAENQHARAFLDALPERQHLLEELTAWDSRRGPTYNGFISRGKVFAMKTDPKKQHPVLVVFDSIDDPAERVLVDPDEIDPTHGHAIDFFRPSTDGRYVAVSLSGGGSESGDVHVYDSVTGKALSDVVPRVNGGTAGGSVAWNPGSTGFFYTRYPRGKERPAPDMDFYQQIWYHRLGTGTEEDTYALGREFPRIAEIVLESSRDGRIIVAAVANGDGGDFEHWLYTPGQPWKQIARIADTIKSISVGPKGDLYLLSKAGAPHGKVLRMRASESLADAKVVVPQSEAVIDGVLPLETGVVVIEMVGGPTRLRYIPSVGPSRELPLPAISSVNGLAYLDDGALLVESTSYLSPPAWFRYDVKTNQLAPTRFRQTSPVSTDDYEVVRDFALSKDGTKVPINIIRRKGIALDSSHPALLTGYGGYGISISPGFHLADFLLLERGFVIAEANLRGGGEFGEEWHDQGRLTRKQNVFDDFAACAHFLIDRKYTQHDKLGILGGSNGGLLMGAELTQHPELFRAVVSFVGIYDMLRVELSPNGAFNVTEFGTVKEADLFRALYAYSPYHHVKDGTQYPAILFMTGDNDPRVDPMNSRKMTARLQATGTRRPVLLRTTSQAGHGIGTAKGEAFSQTADSFAFLIQQLTGN
jgi:prolyl oligopeptidase